MKRLLCAASMALVFSGPALAGPEEALFETAKIIYQSAEDQESEIQALSYTSVRTILNQIVSQYPSSDLAVRIILRDTIDGIDVSALDAALEEASAGTDTAVEAVEPAQEAVATIAPEQPASEPVEDTEVITLELAAVPQEMLVPEEIEEPARSEEEIVTDVQTELNRLGCPAGPADGVVGRKTRSAFSNFIKDSSSDLKDEDLISEAAVMALKEQEGTVCKTRSMATTSASALAGSWGFRSECPGFGSRIYKNEGRLSMNYVGNQMLRGKATNQQGISGPATIQFQGGRIAATIINFGFVTVRGNLSRSTRNMTISGTGSNRCKITAWKN